MLPPIWVQCVHVRVHRSVLGLLVDVLLGFLGDASHVLSLRGCLRGCILME